MLKIKDNVDLKELEKFGLIPRYDKYTGKIDYFEQIYGYPYLDNAKRPFIKIVKKNKRKIFKWRVLNQDTFGLEVIYPEHHRNAEYFLDTLYDLIKADLVEKVSDDNE